MANKVVNYKKIRTDIINGKKRCIYMKPKGKREYVKSKGEFVLLSVHIKKMQKKMKIKGGGGNSFAGSKRISESGEGVAKYPWIEPHPYYGEVYANKSSNGHRRPVSNSVYNNTRHTTVTSRAYMEGLRGKDKPTLLEVDKRKLELPPHPEREKSYYSGISGKFHWSYPGLYPEWQKKYRYERYIENARDVENKNRIEAFKRGQQAKLKIESSLFPRSKNTKQNPYNVSADLVFANH